MPETAALNETLQNGQLTSHALLLYDGVCGLCNSAVLWVIARDHHDRFRFAPQQSPFATVILRRHGMDHEAMLESNSVYLVLDAGSDHEKLFTQSDVTVNSLLLLGGHYRIFGFLLRAVPLFLRNAAYRLFARNRYRLSRRYDACPVPAAGDRKKFLS
jgi:predicted DCC family thiol-disulfide oxidoreductase YuxK